MPKVLCLTSPSLPLGGLAREQLPPGWTMRVLHRSDDDAEKVEAVRDADFILSCGHNVGEDLLSTGKNVKLVQLASAGWDRIDVRLAGELGIPVANNGGANAIPVAEFALTLIMATYRNLRRGDLAVRNDDWYNGDLLGQELFGKTVGIVGAGRIGSMLARLLRGFETTTLYTDVIRSQNIERVGARRVDLDELMSTSDVVSLHVPLMPSTDGLIGARELGLMKPAAILINTCRGQVVDEAALLDTLSNRRIYGAGIDVFQEEPTPADNPLLELDNVTVGPHMAGRTGESFPRRVAFAFENMARVWAGDAPESVVTETA